MRGVMKLPLLLAAVVVFLLPSAAFAQFGNLAGVVKDSQGGVVPGVTVEASSPALIEKVRSTITDKDGRYQIISLQPGTYKVTFSLQGFNKVEQANVTLNADFTATIDATMKPGDIKEVVTVRTDATQVDTKNARQLFVFSGDDLKDLPTSRNLSDLYQLVPGISIAAAGPNDAPRICSGGVADPSGTIFNAGSTASGSALGGSPAIFAPSGSTSGSLSGCGPLMEDFNAHSASNDFFGLNQGRVQVDGMGVQSFAGGGRSAYVVDIANAQEITFTLSGTLGESETGGTTINIVPRTGGNRYSGNYFTSYGDHKFYGKNNETRPSTFNNRLDYQYDVNGSYGGPILRDRLWFQGSARRQDVHNILRTSYRNLNQGVFGANYIGDPNSPVMQSSRFQNASMRLTLQATQKNKFNLSWDEQYTCENPCKGTSGSAVSLEASPSTLTYPLHNAQISWTNPLTNKILLDGGVSHYSSHRNLARNRFEPEYPDIPSIVESGATIATVSTGFGQMTSGSINNTDNWNTDNIQSRASASYVTGSHNLKLGYQGGYLKRATTTNFNNLRQEYLYQTPAGTCGPIAPASGSVVGSATPLWCGLLPDGRRAYDGRNPTDTVGTIVSGAVVEIPLSSVVTTNTTQNAQRNAWLVQNGLVTQGGTVAAPTFTSTALRPPIPRAVTQFVDFPTDEHAWFAGVYLQDQWTWNRFTLSGALRYDLARSGFNKTCVENNLYVPKELEYCLNDGGVSGDGKGVDFQDLTPRWGVAWDVFGNGKTSLKWNMQKGLGGTQVGGIFTAMNPAQVGRSLNNYTRGWLDLNGDRHVDCDLTVPIVAPAGSLPTNGECGGEEIGNTQTNAQRFARNPYEFNQQQLNQTIGTASFYCGMQETNTNSAGQVVNMANQRVIDYCRNYAAAGGHSLISGWGTRAYTWNMSLGVQHELLPRMTMEVTYNRNWQGNRILADSICIPTNTGAGATSSTACAQVTGGVVTGPYITNGCDLYSTLPGGTNDSQQCVNDLLAYNSPFYEFYSVNAPEDPRLPGGGGYEVSGNAVANTALTTATNVTVNTLDIENRIKRWNQSVDVNVTMRARGGIRINGGTSTAFSKNNTCGALVDNPPSVTLRLGQRSCEGARPALTNVRGQATYTIPWVDVLFSSSFSYRPGSRLSANYTTDKHNVIWGPYSQDVDAANVTIITGNTVTTNLLNNDYYGEGIRLFDIRLAKNLRFGRRRVNIGADVYNAFNSDAAIQYCTTFPNCGTAGTTSYQDYRQVTTITTPRYARFQVQFDF